MKKMNKKAFTLIELIVTIAVLGILVLLASPRFFGHVQNAELTKGFANAKSIEKASELYYMDYEDWPRLTDEPYTSEEIESYSERIFDNTGHEVNLDPEGNYYDIDYDKLSDYVNVPDDKKNYILQNPVGKIYYMENLNEAGIARVDYSKVEEEDDNPIPIGEPINFAYTGEPQDIELGKGTYQLEVWGAQGGNSSLAQGGKGGYSIGTITLNEGQSVKIYVGGRGETGSNVNGGWNGGGGNLTAGGGSTGGGATDIRLNGTSLTNRIIVAGAGSGGAWQGRNGAAGGGLIGQNGRSWDGYAVGLGGTQSSGGSYSGTPTGGAQKQSITSGALGKGGRGSGNSSGGSGGGGGYYGGGGGLISSGGGGSSYIGGVQNGQTIDGNQSMPNPNGGNMVGNSGHGFARITRVD